VIALCKDGLTLSCESYKSIEDGVVLCADEDREDVVGFVPHDELKYIVPEEALRRALDADEGTTTDDEYSVSYESFGVPWFSATGSTR
jgi:hypothetical protein